MLMPHNKANTYQSTQGHSRVWKLSVGRCASKADETLTDIAVHITHQSGLPLNSSGVQSLAARSLDRRFSDTLERTCYSVMSDRNMPRYIVVVNRQYHKQMLFAANQAFGMQTNHLPYSLALVAT